MPNKPKRKPAPARTSPRTVNILDRDCIGPDELSIAGGMRNEKEVAAWWERVKLFARAMQPLNRTVLLREGSEGEWFVSSVPDELHPEDRPDAE